MTRHRRMRACLKGALLLSVIAIVVPVGINPTLRSEYIRLLAHWRAKVEAPAYVFIGDSITAGGGVWGWRLGYDPLSAINLGQSGLLTRQIADQAAIAAKYHPKMIVVMAGTNDAISPIDGADLIRSWDRLFSSVGQIPVIVTVPVMTDSRELNVSIENIDSIVTTIATAHSARVINLNGELAPDGLIEPRYTIDGVHLTDAAYAVWASKLLSIINTAPSLGKPTAD